MAGGIFKNRYRTDGKEISDKAFYAIIGGILFFGFLINALEVWFMGDIFLSWNPTVFFVTYCVLLIVGVLLNVLSRNPVVSFIGYCMVVLPIGAFLSILLPEYAPTTVRSAFLATALISAAMVILAVLYPRIFHSIFAVVSVCLIVALIYQLIAMFTGFSTGVWWDWLVVILFCCYVGFDVSLARNRTKTLDNAVDSACGLYLDIVNIFLRLLAIFGRNDG